MFWPWNKKNKEDKFNWDGVQNLHGKEISIIDHLIEGVLIFDRKNRLFLVNLPVERLFGIRKKDVLGKTIFELNRLPNLRELSSFLGSEIYKSGKKRLEIRDNFILEITIIPIVLEEKQIGTLVILFDISREELINKTKSEFVALAAHQLWTPTSAIKWALQMLLDGQFGDLNTKQKKVIKSTYQANNREIRLIGNLLDVARIEEGKYLSNVALIDIGEIISSLMNDYKREIEKKKLKVEFKKTEDQLSKVMADSAKIKIAIGNILSNAIKYTPSGGKIRILVEQKEKEIEVQISDTGLGIPTQEQERVFTKFFRAGNVSRVDTEGTGLGLYITKNIIETHGGRIWFISQEGKGTTFHFTIPIKKEFGEFVGRKFY